MGPTRSRREKAKKAMCRGGGGGMYTEDAMLLLVS